MPAGVQEILYRIQGEFLEMPGLKLTRAQARRLWGIDEMTCDTLLEVLVESNFLARTRDGSFVRSESIAHRERSHAAS
jgi:hypothetical protein